jgi:Brp/Blh family beta-carotene 15,15'-monooxygenase
MKFGTWVVAILFFGLSGVSVVNTALAEWASLILIIVAGIPHGSFDLRVAQRKWGGRDGMRWSLVAGYLALVVLMSGFCLLQPFLGLLSFLVISALHFSEGESVVDGSTYSVRGCCVGVGAILLPIGLHLEEAYGYLGFFIPQEVYAAVAPWLHASAWFVGGVVVLSEVRQIVKDAKSQYWVSLERLLCVCGWVLLSPLAGFAVWFLGRHSRMHLEACGGMFTEGRCKMPLDFLFISVAAVVLLAPFALVFDLTDIHQLFTATLALIAGLTLPHIVVSHRLQDVV